MKRLSARGLVYVIAIVGTGASSMQLGSVSAVSITDREGRMLATATL